MTGLRPDDLQRPVPGSSGQPEIKLSLPGSDPSRGNRLQRSELGLVVRRADMLDLPRTAP